MRRVMLPLAVLVQLTSCLTVGPTDGGLVWATPDEQAVLNGLKQYGSLCGASTEKQSESHGLPFSCNGPDVSPAVTARLRDDHERLCLLFRIDPDSELAVTILVSSLEMAYPWEYLPVGCREGMTDSCGAAVNGLPDPDTRLLINSRSLLSVKSYYSADVDQPEAQVRFDVILAPIGVMRSRIILPPYYGPEEARQPREQPAPKGPFFREERVLYLLKDGGWSITAEERLPDE